ncbi:multiheme c-type cytochrome [Sorangium sp. So ce204]|uniref:multiheme c-type cytochrome n=1 Tax=Sorangium sp. So ce204 TaxID=3133288 RepID=UPI003F5DD880
MRRCAPGLGLLVAGALAGACAAAPDAPARPAGDVEAPAGGALPGAAEAARVPMPGPARARLGAAVIANRACEGCHEEVAREWRASLHHRANTEPAYRRAFAIEPMPFCRACHAPEARPEEPEPEALGALGVGCVTCHVTTDGEGELAGQAVAPVLAAPWAGRGAPPAAPHAVIRDARFGGADACAACHEFAFPTARGRSAAELMQSTVIEHRASPAADQPCAACHMPRGPGGRRGHGFAGSRDEALVRSAVAVTARRLSATRVAVTLAPANAGHAFPTGDLFRRLEVSAEALGPDELVLGQETRYLARHFALRPGAIGRKLVADDRVHAEPVTVELDVGAAGEGRAIAWQVAYQRVAHPNGVDLRDAEIEGEIRVASGRLAP